MNGDRALVEGEAYVRLRCTLAPGRRSRSCLTKGGVERIIATLLQAFEVVVSRPHRAPPVTVVRGERRARVSRQEEIKLRKARVLSIRKAAKPKEPSKLVPTVAL